MKKMPCVFLKPIAVNGTSLATDASAQHQVAYCYTNSVRPSVCLSVRL